MTADLKATTAGPRVTSRTWKPEEEARLRALAEQGATLLRACAAIGRPLGTVKKKTVAMGLSFAGVRKVRANLRASGALETDSGESRIA